MDHDVTMISGIGPKISADLKQHGITTVGQLAAADPQKIPMTKLFSLVPKAKGYLAVMGGKPETPKIVIGGNSGPLVNPAAVAPSKPEQQPHTYLIESHSWYEMKVLLARPDGPEADQKVGLREAIIYELSLEPNQRVSFVCSWVVTQGEKQEEVICTMTYSPQFILFFNSDMPKLEVSLTPTDYETLPLKHVLENVLEEVKLMQTFAMSE